MMDIRKGKYTLSSFHYLTYLSKLAMIALAIASIFFVSNRMQLSYFFPIKIVRIYGINHVDQTEIKNLLLPSLTKGFFGVQVGFIKEKLIQLPWVSDIFIRKTWPDQLDILIVEKNAIARWNHQHLLSKNGELFMPNMLTYPNHLPELVGPTGEHMLMLQYFNDMNRLLMPLHAKISSLELSTYLTWKLILDNGIILNMGHKDVLTRINHFVKVYSQVIGNRVNEVAYVDLRYPNGLAVGWKFNQNSPVNSFLMRKK